MTQSNLCSVAQLEAKLDSSDLVIIDGSWNMPASGRDPYKEYCSSHIKGAMFFDIDQISAPVNGLPHMLPTPEQFEQSVTQMGISNDSDIVIYDTAGLFSAARVWWTFKVFGHKRVQVLDGGFPAWLKAQTNDSNITSIDERLPPQISRSLYRAEINETFLATRDVLIGNIETNEFLILDARSAGRFTGAEPEPREGLRSGHMPNSQSLPFERLINQGCLKSSETLTEIFAEYGLDAAKDDRPIITTCGSGVTAAIISLALAEAGFSLHKLYDGAWCEWASNESSIVLMSV